MYFFWSLPNVSFDWRHRPRPLLSSCCLRPDRKRHLARQSATSAPLPIWQQTRWAARRCIQIITNIQYLVRSRPPIYRDNSIRDQKKSRDGLAGEFLDPASGSSEFSFSSAILRWQIGRNSSSETKVMNHESSSKFKTCALGRGYWSRGDIGDRFFIDGLDPW